MALAVFALGAVVLAGAYLNILNGYDVANRANQANEDVAFARSLVLQEPDRTKLEQGGQFETAEGHQVQWSVDIESTNIADLFTVTFTCESTAADQREPEKTVETFTVLRPTWSVDASERDKLLQDAKTRILEIQGKQTNTTS